jgi:hypothetical protein
MSPDARGIPDSEVDVPCVTTYQQPLQTLNGIIPVPGPGGYTLLFGGLDISSVLRSGDNLASSQTSRELEWNAWEEYPRSIRATGFERGNLRLILTKCEMGKMRIPLTTGNAATSAENATWTVNLELNAILAGTPDSVGLGREK